MSTGRSIHAVPSITRSRESVAPPLAPPPRKVLPKFIVIPPRAHAEEASNALLLVGQFPVRLGLDLKVGPLVAHVVEVTLVTLMTSSAARGSLFRRQQHSLEARERRRTADDPIEPGGRDLQPRRGGVDVAVFEVRLRWRIPRHPAAGRERSFQPTELGKGEKFIGGRSAHGGSTIARCWPIGEGSVRKPLRAYGAPGRPSRGRLANGQPRPAKGLLVVIELRELKEQTLAEKRPTWDAFARLAAGSVHGGPKGDRR